MAYQTLREIWNESHGRTLVVNSLDEKLELVDCRRDAVLFDRYGQARILNPDKVRFERLNGRFPTIVEELRELPGNHLRLVK